MNADWRPAALVGLHLAVGLLLGSWLWEPSRALLWERHEHGWLTHGTYEEIGGVAGALTRYADHVYEEMDADERTQARHVFGQLVRPGKGTEDTRRVATLAALGEENWALVQHLADRRLVVTGRP